MSEHPPNDFAQPPFPAYDGDGTFVFVCHAHENNAVVYPELVRLREAGVNIWYDEGITPGSEWTDALAHAIRSCESFLYFVSAASVASRHCRDEVQFALTHHKRLVAVHLEPTQLPGGLELMIGSTQAILKHRLDPMDYERKLISSLLPRAVTGKATAGDHAAIANDRTKSRRWMMPAVVVAAIALASAAYLFLPAPTVQITDDNQITTSRIQFPPFPSPQSLATDGVRIYFNEWNGGEFVPREVSVKGGESLRVEAPRGFPNFIAGTSPDLSELVLGSAHDGPWYMWSPAGTSPRRLGTLEGHDLSWSADGSRLVALRGNDVYVANADGSDERKIYSSAVHPTWARLAPDAKRIRFTNWPSKFFQIWEIDVDGANPHQILAGWNDLADVCCGSWTPDGRHYVFQATRDNQRQLWAINEGRGLGRRSSSPYQLTKGPMNFIRPLISPDGKRLFAVGWILRGEVTRYDAASQQFVPVPHFESRSVEWLTYSADGKRAAYIFYPEGDLWSSDADGSNATQLTHPPMRAHNAVWVPGGTSVSFVATKPESDFAKVYVVDANGTAQPHALTSHDRAEWSQTWSPDGMSVAFSTLEGIRIFNPADGKESGLQGAEAYRLPSWSPDGRHLTAVANGPKRIMLLDVATMRWEELAPAPHAVGQAWSADGLSVLYFSEDPETTLYRIRLDDRRSEPVLSLKNERYVWGTSGIWIGAAPDGSPLYLRDQSVQHIYRLDWDA